MNSCLRLRALAATAVCVVGCTLAAAAGLAAPAGAASLLPFSVAGANTSDSTQVVVQRGGSVEIAFTPDLTGCCSSNAPSLANAIQMAVEAHPVIRGFPIQINEVNMPCGGGLADQTPDQTAAASIVNNAQNVGVIGPFCSTAATWALPIFDQANVVAVSGSTTYPFLLPYGPNVFNSVAVPDEANPYLDEFDPWYAIVTTLPSDLAWQQAYSSEFGSAPGPFADLYYDATSLLIRDVQNTSSIDGGNLVIDRVALAQAVRATTKYQGVTCRITLDPATGYRVNDPTALAHCAS